MVEMSSPLLGALGASEVPRGRKRLPPKGGGGKEPPIRCQERTGPRAGSCACTCGYRQETDGRHHSIARSAQSACRARTHPRSEPQQEARTRSTAPSFTSRQGRPSSQRFLTRMRWNTSSNVGRSFTRKRSGIQPRRWVRMPRISASAIRSVTTITASQRTQETSYRGPWLCSFGVGPLRHYGACEQRGHSASASNRPPNSIP